ncbi:family 43 glycosylhydrolase [Sphingobacterium oryzagri]|uniref:Family 43 glycosylhydrolase n=1 Tax=Sphingobacterium oryzagri TaxID=3025669 RepID=A0ABY7WFN7_9SPHI|nr:family 43 glycosylhydrolase [Sphingobacterium sp. KACC 22765]WDF68285.1 family 43 glycosylhydrolase [Sphingobacterium sp. KACC 22765]
MKGSSAIAVWSQHRKLVAMRLLLLLLVLFGSLDGQAQRLLEYLDRGLLVLKTSEHSNYISWRLLATDDYAQAFNIYRQYDGQKKTKLNKYPLTKGTNFLDDAVDNTRDVHYTVATLVGKKEKEEAFVVVKGTDPVRTYLEIPLRTPAGYVPGDVSVADLDGDGSYEIVVHQTGKAHDNAHNGLTDEPIFQAYKLDGTFLWEINLGKNVREGAHYTQFMLYDLDSDGRAELVCKTADGTRDGKGDIIGQASADWRDTMKNSSFFGRILTGPEYLTVFDGLTGEALSTVDYLPARGDLQSWGDKNANRSDRFLACVAYLDGTHPSVVMTRGYYERTALAAWDFKDKKLVSRWVFDTQQRKHPYSGQGFHNLAVADVDQDGKDEIVFGAMTIDDDGIGLYSTGLGHGDALHVSDLDPDRPGLEIFSIHELKGGRQGVGAALRDAKTGKILYKGAIDQDVPRGVAANIDPKQKGAYMWWLGAESAYDMQGKAVGPAPKSVNFLIWWDADLSRELLNSNRIEKYQQGEIFEAKGALSINGTKNTPNLNADILGDWREELILRSEDNQTLRIYSTTIPTDHRLYTLMQDPQYRLSIAWQNVAYNQPPHTSYYLGTGMDKPVKPNIQLVKPERQQQAKVPKPLYRDPIEDGAADPAVVWHAAKKCWYMLYTNRRAKSAGLSGVSWVHGTAIGIATSKDAVHWQYLDTARFDSPKSTATLWAPDVFYHQGTYHMYLTVVPGVFEHWQHPRSIEHFTSKDLRRWTYQSTLNLSSDKVIDACVLALPQGGFRMWYNNEKDGKSVYYADSDDLYTWTDKGKALATRGEGPKVFAWKEQYWMVVDTWKGLAIYRSTDLLQWNKQPELILDKPGISIDDAVVGGHADVIVEKDRAYIYYFTHPGRTSQNKGKDDYEQRRSSVQLAELHFADGKLSCVRDAALFADLER